MIIQVMKNKYDLVCSAYVNTFADILGIEFDNWVGDNVGEVANFSDDSFYSFEIVKYFVDNAIDADTIQDWYDYTLEFGEHIYFNPKAYVGLKNAYIDYFNGLGFRKDFKFNADKFHLHLIKDRLDSLINN